MSADDDSSRGKKSGTVPGFGLPQTLGPMKVEAMEANDETLVEAAAAKSPFARDPEPSSAESSSASSSSEVVDGEMKMMVEPTPAIPQQPVGIPQTQAQAVEAMRRPPKGPPAVDIDLVYERRSAPLPDQPWVFLEIWTRNTIYQLDSALLCVDVIDQATRRSVGDHALRGARLVGGQSRDGEAMELSHPFPRPGSEAVFEQLSGRHVRFSQTSTVTRVVMRLRVLTVDPEQLLPTWEDVSGKWDAQAIRKDAKK